MDRLIRSRQFYSFVVDLINRHNKETEEDMLWEAWLHKCLDKSFAEFRDSVKAPQTQTMTEKEKISVVKASNEILQNFVVEDSE